MNITPTDDPQTFYVEAPGVHGQMHAGIDISAEQVNVTVTYHAAESFTVNSSELRGFQTYSLADGRLKDGYIRRADNGKVTDSMRGKTNQLASVVAAQYATPAAVQAAREAAAKSEVIAAEVHVIAAQNNLDAAKDKLLTIQLQGLPPNRVSAQSRTR